MTFHEDLKRIASSELWLDYATPIKGRQLIGDLFLALLRSPRQLRVNRFDPLGEDRLDHLTQQAGELLQDQGAHHLLGQANEDSFDHAIGLLRYLDEVLNDTSVILNKYALPSMESKDFWVIPCRHRNYAKRGQGLRRRALRYHQVLPRQLDGYTLQMNLHSDISKPNAPARYKLGAGIFPQFDLDLECPTKETFVAIGANCPDQDQLIETQLEEAHLRDCSLVVWPELTMPPDLTTKVCTSLKSRHLKSALPTIVVTGSWHVTAGDKVMNRCQILNGRGQSICAQDKALAFFERRDDTPREAIDDTETINILITDRDIIGVFICLDFCHQEAPEFLKQIGLSVAIVPSMGNQSTMREHEKNAKHLARATDLETVVVQQVLKGHSSKVGGDGYVWAYSSNTKEHDPIPTCEQFTTFQV